MLDPEDFPEGDPCDNLKLEELRCDTFAGFIWVNMDPDCVSLREYLGPVWDAETRMDRGQGRGQVPVAGHRQTGAGNTQNQR